MTKTKAKAESPVILSSDVTLAPWDAAEVLTDDETIALYLSSAASEADPDVFLNALATVARARGMTEIARKTGLGRQGLYRALAPGANPHYRTVRKVLDAIGVPFFTPSRSA
ncbi:putative addiction module antidote protein [Alcaligenaceae bacterium B3P038]|nr:putative addiction module antidote protein [Alcaligenaceae bacterium B3P038]